MLHQTATPEPKKELIAMPGHTRLFRRNGTYYLRAKVPEKLRPIIGKREIFESLRTKDYKDAVRRIKPLSQRVDIEFEAAEANLAAEHTNGKRASLRLSDEDIYAIVYDCFIRAERKNEAWMNTVEAAFAPYEVSAITDGLKEDLAGNEGSPDALPAYRAAERILAEYCNETGRNLNLEKDSENYRKLLSFANRAYVESTHRMIDRLETDGSQFQRRDAAFEKFVAQSEPPQSSGCQVTLGEFLDGYEADKKARLSKATANAIVLPLRVLREVVGAETKLTHITREHMMRVADVLSAIPKNMAQRYPGLSIEKAIVAGKRDGAEMRDKNTLANNWIHVTSALNDATDTYSLSRNPAHFKRLRSRFKKSKVSTKRPFTIDELNAVFSSPSFTQRLPDGRLEFRVTKPERFWVPLISLFQGCRANEVCQLEVTDVMTYSNSLCLFVRESSESDEDDDNDDGKKSTKTEESVRIVPLHPMLLKLGFREFVEERRVCKGSSRLFPAIRFDHTKGTYSTSISKWFSRLISKVCGKNAKVSLHCLRHTFRYATREALILEEIGASLGGWTVEGGTMLQYAGKVPIHLKQDAITKVAYPGLDLSHLLPASSQG